jgi:hypothetical protein
VTEPRYSGMLEDVPNKPSVVQRVQTRVCPLIDS